MNKKNILLAVVGLAAVVAGSVLFHGKQNSPQILGAGGPPVTYNSANMATSSVGTYVWTSVLSPDSSRRYVSLCNDNLAANSAIYLAMGATSTVSSAGMLGIRVAGGNCYEMTETKMFYGTVYAIASSATSTLLKLSNIGY